MAWYYGTYSCGHEGRVNIIGPVKDRQWKADRHFEKMCPECYAKYIEEQRAKENAEAAEKAKEMELPELKGTKKQVEWANTLRQKVIDMFEAVEEEKYRKMAGLLGLKIKYEELSLVLDYILSTYDSATYYIENRDRNFYKILEQEVPKALKPVEQKLKEEAEARIQAELRAEATVYPENKITEAVVEIIAKEDKITAKFEKNDKFIDIVKSLGYKWGGCWTREISETTGSYKDRAAELGNKLLNAGFPIMIMDPEIRNKAISGEFEPECDRWIYARKDDNAFAIKWKERNDRLYTVARKLPGSKWSSGAVVVKVEHYQEVQEFAELYGFRFTTKAQNLIHEHIEATKKIPVVTAAKVEDVKEKDGLQEILNSGSEIIDDLKD